MINTLINADCLQVLPKIKSKTIDLILTDIPYGEVNRSSNGLRNLTKETADHVTFNLEDFLSEVNRVCRGTHYIFCGTLQISTILYYFKQNKLSTRLCVWQKSNPSPMNGQHLWLSGLETCAFAKNNHATYHEHCKTGIWKYPCGRNKHHPTEKPLELMKYLINTSTNEGDLILDPCMGSGTIPLAAKQTGRNYIGIETDPTYYTTATTRLKQSIS